MTTTERRPTTRANSTGRNPWIVAAIIALALKLPLVAIGVLNPAGIAGSVPATAIGPGLYLTIAFLLSSMVFLALRNWYGVISAAAYGLYSLVGGVLLFGRYPWWAMAIVATSLAALAFTALALRSGAFLRAAARSPRD